MKIGLVNMIVIVIVNLEVQKSRSSDQATRPTGLADLRHISQAVGENLAALGVLFAVGVL